MLTNINTLASAGTTTVSFANGAAAAIVILALFGIYAVANMQGWVRTIVLILLVGILFVNVQFLHDAAQSLRHWMNGQFADWSKPELASDITFTLGVVILFGLFVFLNSRSREGDNKWLWAMIVLAFLFFTASWPANAIVWISDHAAMLLGWTSNIHN
ncbi:MAG TPA: hypothetical protein VFL85_04800 [Candidatus Saccharimonadales bacterium]|nr:hypothetical protein [Candidatus Saccharimonadales bacterium]